jgi:uncharacterized membrane protein
MWRSGRRPLGRRQQRVRELSRKGWRVWGLIVGVLAAVWGAAAWFAISQEKKERASDNLPEIVLEAGQNFVYDLAQLQSGQTRFFTYPTSSSERSRLLVQRDADGAIRTAFASCIACYSHRREHKLSKGNLICGKCQSAMRIGDQHERLTADKGCVGVPVTFSVVDNKVIVRPEAITEGIKAFANPTNGAVQGQGSPKGSESRP